MWFRNAAGLLGLGSRRAYRRGQMFSWGHGDFDIEGIASLAFHTAVDLCGNEGQVSIIDQMGLDAFYEACFEAINEGDAVDALMGLCPYPDAVGEILEEAGGVINDILGYGMSDSDDEEEMEE